MLESRDRPRFSLNGDSHHFWFLLLLFAFSFAAQAQSGKVYRIGVLELTAAKANRANLNALMNGLREAGYVEGRNLVIDYRSADGRSERFPDLAVDLARAKPDVIVTRGTPAALAARNAGSIPVVMAASADPVGLGVVSSLARPGGHVTGLTAVLNEIAPKRVEILKELVPGLSKVGVAISSGASKGQLQQLQRTAKRLGVESVGIDVSDLSGLGGALQQARKDGVGALVIGADVIAMPERQRALVDLSLKHRLPAIYVAREPVAMGGLVSYGVHYPDLYYRAAAYVDKILKGAKPGDLPIEQPTKLELVINLKTAQALGIDVPQRLLLRADEVIQ
jgi:putative ABC transport system substrate-binding protein